MIRHGGSDALRDNNGQLQKMWCNDGAKRSCAGKNNQVFGMCKKKASTNVSAYHICRHQPSMRAVVLEVNLYIVNFANNTA